MKVSKNTLFNGMRYLTSLPFSMISGLGDGRTPAKADGPAWAEEKKDILERAAYETTKGIVMAKVFVTENEGVVSQIISTKRTIATFSEDFDYFMSIFSDARDMICEEYWKIMQIEHPEECQNDEDDEQQNDEDLATKMAQMAGEHNKIQS